MENRFISVVLKDIVKECLWTVSGMIYIVYIFDAEHSKLHTLECVYKASALRKTVSFPRISPDGRFLLFTQSDYGNFSIWHPESDLYLLNLATGNIRNIAEINSDNVDSFHTWSSTGRWLVFSSKRLDGLWARPFFAHFDPETGHF